MHNYFWNGLEHFITALIFIGIYIKLWNKKTNHPFYWTGLVFTSSSIFFIPLHIYEYGPWFDRLYQFLHYPVLDWDILLFGISWHRFFIIHSFIILLLLITLLIKHSELRPLFEGICIGISSHLILDGITCSLRTPVVFIPGLCQIDGYAGKEWLIINGFIVFLIAYYYNRIFQE